MLFLRFQLSIPWIFVSFQIECPFKMCVFVDFDNFLVYQKPTNDKFQSICYPMEFSVSMKTIFFDRIFNIDFGRFFYINIYKFLYKYFPSKLYLKIFLLFMRKNNKKFVNQNVLHILFFPSNQSTFLWRLPTHTFHFTSLLVH